MRQDSDEDFERYLSMLDKPVRRVNNEPFKSGRKVNTVTAVWALFNHPGQYAFAFMEDDSYVECFQCIEASELEVSLDQGHCAMVEFTKMFSTPLKMLTPLLTATEHKQPGDQQ